MNRKIYKEIYFPCERDSLGEALQMFYGLGVKTIPLIYGGYERIDRNFLDNVKEVPADVIRMTRRLKSNIGIELGRNSRNLFVATFLSKADYDEMSPSMHGYDRWVSMEGSKCHVWLFLKGGIGEDCQTLKYKIQSEGIILAPSSVDQNGEFCSWVKREDIFPPEVDKNEVKEIFPQISIKAFNPQYLDGMQLNINNEEVRSAIAYASTIGWPGRSGTSLYKGYIAYCLRASLESIDNFRASDREISEIAGISDKTVRLVKKGLIEMNAIYRVRTNSISNHYGLNKDFFQKSTLPKQHVGMILPILNNDAFSRTGLNPSGARIYSLLLINPQAMIKDISRILEIGYSTAKKSMQMLSEKGLVINKDGLWVAVPSSKSKLEKIAKTYGVYGRGKTRKRVHREQRNKFISSSVWNALKQPFSD